MKSNYCITINVSFNYNDYSQFFNLIFLNYFYIILNYIYLGNFLFV